MERIYRGHIIAGRWRVSVSDGDRCYPLAPRNDLADHSPTGFCWGYAGSGPAQTALAVLCDALGDDQRALRLHQRFKYARIAGLPTDEGWMMTQATVVSWAEIHD